MKPLVAIVALAIASCSPTKLVTKYNADGFDITQLKGSTVRLYVSSNVRVTEFKKAFESEYNAKPEFISAITTQLSDGLSTLPLLTTGNTDDADMLLWGHVANRESVFAKADEKYLIGIRQINISNKVPITTTFETPSTVSTPVGEMPKAGGTKQRGSEDCVVTITAEVWSAATKEKVSVFDCTGTSTVFLLRFGTALTNAVEDAVTTFCEYVKENLAK